MDKNFLHVKPALLRPSKGQKYESLHVLQGVLDAPKARKEAYTVKAPHGKERNDNYYWLRDDDRENPEVLDYLKVDKCFMAVKDCCWWETEHCLFGGGFLCNCFLRHLCFITCVLLMR